MIHFRTQALPFGRSVGYSGQFLPTTRVNLTMHALLLTLAFVTSADPTPPEGVLPTGKDGKALNLDFETGTLQDWTAAGDAFQDQPILGDTVVARRADNKSEHQGKYWIGGFEKHGDKPQGTLTSVPFKVTHDWGSFLVGGGPHTLETCVEIIDVAKKEVIFRAGGDESENLKRVAVDLSKFQGKEIQVRIVDKHTGHWGHINFDDFRFHTEKPKVNERPAPVADAYKYAGLSPKDAAKAMTVPKGFSVDVIAAEPDLHQPIAFCWDDRGRLWVVEAYTYPKRHPEPGPVIADKKLGDKIIILEDTDGDGTFDKRTVFMEGLNLVSGIEFGFGGVWVGAAPYLVFIPIDPKTEKAGEPKILLDGFGYQDTHETLNSFVWGPDGWLYGCHGVFTHSAVGKPGAKEAERTKINAGIWRYHPTKHVFELFAEGTSNPWGLDYNANGDFFIEACVIPHLYHIVQGGRYQRQAGQHFNPYTYDDIKTIAKHRHYVGNQWNTGDLAKSSDVGGGHAHSGLMIYQGGAWPKEYNGKLFMANLHGHRINVDEVTPKGSSYEGDRNPDFLLTHDKWSIIVAIHSGPDGNVYFCDWYDQQICHRNEPEIWDRTNGRLYRVKHESTKPVKAFDLQKCSDTELVKYQLDANDWYARHARRILQERNISRDAKRSEEARKALRAMIVEEHDAAISLRAMWTLYNVDLLDEKTLEQLRHAKDDHIKGWAFYFSILGSHWPKPAPSFTGYGMTLQSLGPIPRRYAASALLQLPVTKRYAPLHVLTKEKHFRIITQAADPLLPMLYWYGVEPMIEQEPYGMLDSMHSSEIPQLYEFTTRRVGSVGTPAALEALIKQLEELKTAPHQIALLHGLQESVKGKRQANAPKGWDAVSPTLMNSENAEVRSAALALAVMYGDVTAFDTLRKILVDTKAALANRQAALTTLLDVRDAKLPSVLQTLLTETPMRPQAIRALASFDDPKTAPALLNLYKNLTPAEKRDAIATLASRVGFAQELLAGLAAKTIPNADIPAETIRQLRNLNDKALNEKIASVWGLVRDTPADRKKLIGDWSRKLNPAVLAKADLGAGRAIYSKVCMQCHTLYGVGGKVGPEITGANRSDLNYLLENIFDPSAVIPKEYAAIKFDLLDGRVITGILKEENQATLTVVTATETLTLRATDVDKRTPSELSMMPDDITKPLSDLQVRDLVAYLKFNAQVPILGDAENAKEFFNGKDLTGWDFDKDVWSVDDGEIVGKTKAGLKANNFVKSTMDLKDFRLTLKTKLTPNTENSGIQFRSVPIENGEMRGPQADMGKGWWGKLYEESGRGLLVKEGGEKFVKEGEWNDYIVEAIGPKVKLWINGNLICDYEDDKLAKRGVIAFQVHSGGPMEVRFKDIKLEVIDAKK